MNATAKITVEGQAGEWSLVSERPTTDPRQMADYAARGWRGVGTVRRTTGHRCYTALVSTDGTFASIIR